jgi:hypothetical protein
MRPRRIEQGDADVPRLPTALPDQKDMPLDDLQKMLHGER